MGEAQFEAFDHLRRRALLGAEDPGGAALAEERVGDIAGDAESGNRTNAGRTPSESIVSMVARAPPPRPHSFPSAVSSRKPSACAIPIPPSTVALPPIPRMRLRTPSSMAARMSSPVPQVVAFMGSSPPGGTSSIPLAEAISMTAVRPSGSKPYDATTGSPRGPVTVTERSSPPVARTTASVVPSPPSAIGITMISASLRLSWSASAMILPASSLLILPLKLSAATTIFILIHPDRSEAGVRRPGPRFTDSR